MSKYTKFNTEWLKEPQFSSWVGVDTNSNARARCILCGVRIELGNMGRQALVSHSKGKKHMNKEQMTMKIKKESQSLDGFFVKPETASPEGSSATRPEDDVSQFTVPAPPPLPVQASDKSQAGSMSNYVTNNSVLSAEILWALKTVVSHYSCSSSAKTNSLFQKMFPDSEIAKKFSCGSTKCSYIIRFGLAPFYKEDLANKVQQPGTIFVVSFDESLNKVLQEEQMDLLLRFWDNELNRVVTRYFDSVFLGHTRAQDLLKKFKCGIGELNTANMLQISMDGPSTNWKFLELLMQDRQELDPNTPSLINIGSCGLHVVHGAFKHGAVKAGWKIDGVLRSVYHCFIDSPARREDYLEANDGNALFGLKFCATRWLEDVPVAERAIQIWPYIQKYIVATQKLSKSKRPTCQSYVNLNEYVQDPLILAKLKFFVSIANILVPFLELFQTDRPMMPFISSELHEILNNLLGRFIKKSVLDSTRNVAKVDVKKKENIVPAEKVDIGFAAKQAVDKVVKDKKASQLQVFEFYQECIAFLQNMSEKLLERCPLKYEIVRAMNALDPKYIASNPGKSSEKMDIILKKLLNAKWMSSGKCDEALQEFKTWVREMELHHACALSSFVSKKDRLDDFYYSHLASSSKFKSLWFAVKTILILSHGQSAVERGFSTNKDLLQDNMAKSTLRAYRQVYDGLLHLPKDSVSSSETKDTGREKSIDISNVTVSSKMLESCRQARVRYSNFLDDEKKKKVASDEQMKKDKLKSEIDSLKSRKRKLESSVDVLVREADNLAQEAEKKMKLDLLVKSNAFRGKVKEKRKEIEETSNDIEKLEKKLSGL